LRTRQDSGPTRMRRRFSSAVDLLDLTFILTANQFARLLRFYQEELKHGALPFIMPDYVNDGLLLTDESGNRLTTENGDFISIAANHLCQFGEALPSASVAGVEWRISFRLEILP
jgi:hypothetical protein